MEKHLAHTKLEYVSAPRSVQTLEGELEMRLGNELAGMLVVGLAGMLEVR